MQKSKTSSGWIYYLTVMLRGMFMGAADIVPGVSGGTIAFITGIYGDLLSSIKSINISALKLLFTLRIEDFFEAISWRFLLALGSGMLLSIVFVAHLFVYCLNHETAHVYLYAAFFGLILASICFCIRQVTHWNKQAFLSLILGAIIAFAFTNMPAGVFQTQKKYDIYLPKLSNLSSTQKATNYHQGWLKNIPETAISAMLAKEIVNQETQLYSQSQQRKGALKEFISSDASFFIDPWMILCGALAISAMLLPGISGSYLLYILGSYAAVIGALADFTLSLKQGSFDATAFLILFNLSIGVVLGAVIFSRFISWLFSSYRQRTIALLVGFMIGAMKTVWPFWLYEYRVMPLKAMEGAKLHLLEPMIPNILGTQQFFALLVMIAAFLSVMTLELFANQKKIPLTISS